jgi:D-aminoacyl-tRNA deacylase
MILVACSSIDVASFNAAKALISIAGLEQRSSSMYAGEAFELRMLDSPLTQAAGADGFGADIIIFMSRHSSASGTSAFTVHPMGNWGPEARLGGLPNTLSVAAPSLMLSILRSFEKSGISIESTYEATHHGPALKTPSLFAEFGGNEATINDKNTAAGLAAAVHRSIMSMQDATNNYSRVVLGIGGTHYPSKFTKLAREKSYAFSHIMPKHAIFNPDGTDNMHMLGQSVEKSSEKVECAVIDWKSINSEARSRIMKCLSDIGIDYERV